jgi:hypothetical protein
MVYGMRCWNSHYPHFCVSEPKQAQLIERSDESNGDWNATPVLDTYIDYKDPTFHITHVELTCTPPLM